MSNLTAFPQPSNVDNNPVTGIAIIIHISNLTSFKVPSVWGKYPRPSFARNSLLAGLPVHKRLGSLRVRYPWTGCGKCWHLHVIGTTHHLPSRHPETKTGNLERRCSYQISILPRFSMSCKGSRTITLGFKIEISKAVLSFTCSRNQALR